MAVESKTMKISGKDVKDFMMRFDSPEEVITTLENKANDLAKDVNALIHLKHKNRRIVQLWL